MAGGASLAPSRCSFPADAMLALDDKDAITAYRAASAYDSVGNTARAAELGAKAIELAEDEGTKAALKEAVAKFGKKNPAPKSE